MRLDDHFERRFGLIHRSARRTIFVSMLIWGVDIWGFRLIDPEPLPAALEADRRIVDVFSQECNGFL